MTKKYNGVNPVNEKSLYGLYQRAQDKIEYIKGSKQLIVQDGGQYLVLCPGDQIMTWSFSIFDKTTQFRVSFDTCAPLPFLHLHHVISLIFNIFYPVLRTLVQVALG
jgi:hypothetical protein